MAGVSREQIEQARRMTAIEYLLKYEAYDLKRCGRSEYELRHGIQILSFIAGGAVAAIHDTTPHKPHPLWPARHR